MQLRPPLQCPPTLFQFFDSAANLFDVVSASDLDLPLFDFYARRFVTAARRLNMQISDYHTHESPRLFIQEVDKIFMQLRNRYIDEFNQFRQFFLKSK